MDLRYAFAADPESYCIGKSHICQLTVMVYDLIDGPEYDDPHIEVFFMPGKWVEDAPAIPGLLSLRTPKQLRTKARIQARLSKDPAGTIFGTIIKWGS